MKYLIICINRPWLSVPIINFLDKNSSDIFSKIFRCLLEIHFLYVDIYLLEIHYLYVYTNLKIPWKTHRNSRNNHVIPWVEFQYVSTYIHPPITKSTAKLCKGTEKCSILDNIYLSLTSLKCIPIWHFSLFTLAVSQVVCPITLFVEGCVQWQPLTSHMAMQCSCCMQAFCIQKYWAERCKKIFR